MTKKEAARALGVSERAVSRYVAARKLGVAYEKNEQGSYTGVYDAAEVRELKERMKQPLPPKVKVKVALKRGRPPKSEALTRRDTDNALAGALIRIAESTTGAAPEVLLRDALTLTLDDAVKLCPGLSRGYMLEAIKAGDLKAIKRRGWVVTRAALDAWVKKLWMK